MWCVSMWNVDGLGGIIAANVFTTQGGLQGVAPSCVRVSHIVSEYRPLFSVSPPVGKSITSRIRVSPLGDEV